MTWQSSFALLIALQLAVSVKANYTLEILMLSYRNPTSMSLSLENFRHGCCERDAATPCNPCDNAFGVCAREVITRQREGACDFKQESELIGENDDDLFFTPGEDVGGLANPIRVSGDMWPGTLEVVFTVFDLDLTTTIGPSSDVVDNVFVYPEVSAADEEFSDPVTFIGNASYSSLELAFRLTCHGPHQYGPDCTFCMETNDSTGHYLCDNRTGEKVCLEGYQGPETNCRDCVPATNCSFRPPVISGVTTVNEGDTLELNCDASNSRPLPPVKWFSPDGNLISNNSQLTIVNITRTLAGNYTCIATNVLSGDTMRISAYITILLPCEELESTDTITVNITSTAMGSNAIYQCRDGPTDDVYTTQCTSDGVWDPNPLSTLDCTKSDNERDETCGTRLQSYRAGIIALSLIVIIQTALLVGLLVKILFLAKRRSQEEEMREEDELKTDDNVAYGTPREIMALRTSKTTIT